jgi:hypothetical protein
MTAEGIQDGRVFLTPNQLAARWQIAPELLATWRHRGDGPEYVKVGQHVRYAVRAVTEYERERSRAGARP